MHKKGFTLIELLVVIAIIGILSSVVLASLNSARGKGANAAIKANLANMRAEGALFYDSNSSSYATFCTGDAVLQNASSSVSSQNGAAGLSCAANATVYSLVGRLNTPEGANDYWCVDSNGYSGYTASTSATAVPCK